MPVRAALESAEWKEEPPPPRVHPPSRPPPLQTPPPHPLFQVPRKKNLANPQKKILAPLAPFIFLCMYYISEFFVHGMSMCVFMSLLLCPVLMSTGC